MLDYRILANKPTIRTISEQGTQTEYKDLLSRSLSDQPQQLYQYKFVEVQEDYIARPDLISLGLYGDDKYADIICKLNGISNPFELNKGMILVIPSLSIAENLLVQFGASELVKTDSEMLTNIVKTNQKLKNERRSPAEQTVGDSTFIIDRTNKIVYY